MAAICFMGCTRGLSGLGAGGAGGPGYSVVWCAKHAKQGKAEALKLSEHSVSTEPSTAG